jgi:hypothetical protein
VVDMSEELAVVVRVDVSDGDATAVSGRLESVYGNQPFSGWLDLFGRLEELVDRVRSEQDRPGSPA